MDRERAEKIARTIYFREIDEHCTDFEARMRCIDEACRAEADRWAPVVRVLLASACNHGVQGWRAAVKNAEALLREHEEAKR